MTTVRINKGEYGKDIDFTVKNPDTNAALSLSDAQSGTITIGRIGKSTKLVDGKSLDLTDKANGIVTYTPSDGDLDTAGYYDVDIKIVYSSGEEIVEKFTLHILDTI